MVGFETRELRGERPTLNSGAVVCHDAEDNVLYYYGGSPWVDTFDEDRFNVSKKPSSNLFKLDLRTLTWQLLTVSNISVAFEMTRNFRHDYLQPDKSSITCPCYEPDNTLPFINSIEEEDLEFRSEHTHPIELPALNDAMAVFYRDPKTSKPYLLVLGGRNIKESKPNYRGLLLEPVQSMHLICIDLSLQSRQGLPACIYWRDVYMQDDLKVRRRFGGTAALVEGLNGSLLLCVFGGHIPNAVNSSHPADTYAVANLTRHSWVTPDHPTPIQVKPLGYRPYVQRLEGIPGKENILFLSGWALSDAGTKVSLPT
ncbi:hypothetical protein SCHPADRAFT_193334 [Schizopora paradoxa]|uniref:Galactose oxidase n=1 Tax=Schizopora paradoxa TaxID=27342 RepID=A0A0H2RYV1_9AGAM|nr:hypothetical protein SCHPADRAFT_193334 [Schizopora paradoxa]